MEHFGKMIGLLGAAPDRVSALLLRQLYGGARSGTLNPAKVVQESGRSYEETLFNII
jgi:hypothetical protein